MTRTWLLFFALAIIAADGVVTPWPNRNDFKAAAAALDISLSDVMPGEDFLFEASIGKRAGTFLLEKSAEILAYIEGGLTQAEKLAASRLVRGYTTSDYSDRDADVEIGTRDGTTSAIGGDAFWSLLCVALDVHLVFPEPPRPTLEYHQAHILVSQIRTDLKAVLITAFIETNGPRRHLWRRALAMHAHASRQDILARIPIVRADLMDRYTVFWHEHLFDDHPYALQDGAGLIVHYGLPAGSEERRNRLRPQGPGDIMVLLAHQAILHPPAGPLTEDPDIAQDPADLEPDDPMEEEDSSEGLATPGESDEEVDPDSTWTTAIVFTYAGDAVVGRVREVHPELEHREVAHMLEIPPNRMVAIHRISHPPEDLLESYQQAHIAQLLHDLPIGSRSKFVLLDVVFCYHLPILDVETVRQVKLITSGIMLLRLTRLAEYCLEGGNPCLVHHNDEIVLSQLDAPISLMHGDYIKITVPPPPTCSSKDTRIAALAHYHGLSAAAYPHLERRMPDGFSINQVPNPARHFNRLGGSPRDSHDDGSDQASLFQGAMDPIQCRIPEDPAALLEPCIIFNEQQVLAAREWQRIDGLRNLPVGLNDLHHFLSQFEIADDEAGLRIQTWFLNHRVEH